MDSFCYCFLCYHVLSVTEQCVLWIRKKTKNKNSSSSKWSNRWLLKLRWLPFPITLLILHWQSSTPFFLLGQTACHSISLVSFGFLIFESVLTLLQVFHSFDLTNRGKKCITINVLHTPTMIKYNDLQSAYIPFNCENYYCYTLFQNAIIIAGHWGFLHSLISNRHTFRIS